ncbi:MAG TPA: energy transducer TonB [Alphaproteobacteria bacterium]|nr:energy transducer TonB [Alphaproteobacteria bacterium]
MTAARPPLTVTDRPSIEVPPPQWRSRWSLAFAAGSLAIHAAAFAALAPWLVRTQSPDITAGMGVEVVFVSAEAPMTGATAKPSRPSPASKTPAKTPPMPEPVESKPEHPHTPEPHPEPKPGPEIASGPAPPTELATAAQIEPTALPTRKPDPPPAGEHLAALGPAAPDVPAAAGRAADDALPQSPADGAGGEAPYSAPRSSGPGLDNPYPEYPPAALRRDIEGRVLLEVTVSQSGSPLEVAIVASSGTSLLDDAALEAVRRWRFIPARQGDRPVAGTLRVPIVFRLTEG